MTWDAEDQGKALAWTIEERGKCRECGTHEWEYGTTAQPVDAYEADGYECPGCALLETERDRRGDAPTSPGMKLVLYRKDTPDGP